MEEAPSMGKPGGGGGPRRGGGGSGRWAVHIKLISVNKIKAKSFFFCTIIIAVNVKIYLTSEANLKQKNL